MRGANVELPPPNLLLSLTEAQRAASEIFSLQLTRRTLRRVAPKGDGHSVMVLPGFLGSDTYNRALRTFLDHLSYTTHGWGQGQNLGPRDGVLEALQQRFIQLTDTSGAPMSLVGHSLGGIFARELAREYPDRVRQVISLGSPFGEGRMSGSLPARLFTALNPPEELPVDQDVLPEAPPVPTTAIYSQGDGIVNWRTTVQPGQRETTESIRVCGSHCGMTLNPAVWYLVADRLAQPEEQWAPFERSSWRQLIFPRAAALGA
ncbi:MAG: alpha/beta hydrolase [Pseudomonadota bacterium]